MLPIITIDKHTREGRRPARDRQPRFHLRGRIGPARKGARSWWRGPSPRRPTRSAPDWGVMKEKIRSDLRRFLIKQTSRATL